MSVEAEWCSGCGGYGVVFMAVEIEEHGPGTVMITGDCAKVCAVCNGEGEVYWLDKEPER